MAGPILKCLVWTMAALAILGNITSILYPIILDRNTLRRSFGIYPFNLAVSDLLMGVYLIIIAQADVRFSGEYVLYDEDWRNGSLCHLAGFMCTLSSETSAVFILLITIDRYLNIQFPFGQYRISPTHTRLLCGLTWLIGLHVASLPLIFDWESYSHHSICVGLPLNSQSYPGSSYAKWIFIGCNSVMFLLIATGQGIIFYANWTNSKKAALRGEQAKRRYKRDMAVARKLSLIAMTNFLCWFPICVMGLMAHGGHKIPDSAYAFSVVVALPVNSSINPSLYTCTPKLVLTATLAKLKTLYSERQTAINLTTRASSSTK